MYSFHYVLQLLNKTGKQKSYEIIDAFRNLESSIMTLKSEREFLKRQMKRLDTQTYSSRNSNDTTRICYEADTQTETHEDVNLCILNETLMRRNDELEEVNTKLNEEIKLQKQLIKSGIDVDKTREKNEELQKSSTVDKETINTLKNDMRKLDTCNNELRHKNMSAEKSLFDLEKRVTEADATVKDLEKKLSQLDEQYKISCQTIAEKKVDIKDLREQIQHRESELTLSKQQMNTEFKKIRNQLSFEAENFAQEKTKTKELENNILRLEEDISDLRITNKKLETDLESRETVLLQEKAKMQDRETEMSKCYGKMRYPSTNWFI